jgi:hypothetical protein
VIEINYPLHTNGGEIECAEIKAPLVPRNGELVDIENRSYQVVDVLWHHRRSGETSVTVTACEYSWHKHIGDVLDAWRRDRETPR